MKRIGFLRRASRLGACLVLGSCCALLLLLLPGAERSANASNRVVLAVVVAKGSAIQDLSLAALRRIFLNEGGSETSGQRDVPFNQPARTSDRLAFDRIVLEMSAAQVSQFWIARKIRRTPGPPRSVNSLSLLLRLVARLPGAIGYARPAQLAGDVRAIRVDGKLPNDPSYPLTFSE